MIVTHGPSEFAAPARPANSNSARHFLLATWEGGGTIPPELGVARRLVDAGHRVTVLADPLVAGPAAAAGADFEAWTSAPHRSSLGPDDDVVRDWETTSPAAMLANLRDRLLIGPAGRFAADTTAAIESHRPDAVLVDSLLLGAMAAAQGAGLPLGVLMPNIWTVPTKGVPAFGPGFAPARGPFGRLRDVAVRAAAARIFAKGMPEFNAVRSGLGLGPLEDLWDQTRTADRVLVMTSASLDFAASHVPPNAFYTGPVLDEPDWAQDWDPPWSETDDRPLVLVALSSTYQAQEQVLARIVQAVESRNVRAVVTLGPAIDRAAVTSSSPDVVIVESAPHGPILERADAAIVHCGHGTTAKALVNGVPLVCVPMGRDQDDTAARVVAAGAGVRVKPKASSDALGKALDAVMTDPRFRTSAQHLADAMAGEMSSADIVGLCEALTAKTKRGAAASSTCTGRPEPSPMPTD